MDGRFGKAGCVSFCILCHTCCSESPICAAKTQGFDDKSGWVRYNIVDLFTSCVKMHSFRIRYFLLNQHVIEKLVKLVSSPLKFLAIGKTPTCRNLDFLAEIFRP